MLKEKVNEELLNAQAEYIKARTGKKIQFDFENCPIEEKHIYRLGL